MNWTDKKPTQPGWYWYRAAGEWEAIIVNVNYEFLDGFEVLCVGTSERYWSDTMRGQWAGPIMEPEG